MVATGSVMAATGDSVDRLARDELAELVIEASTHLETDISKAKLCIRRAAHLVRDRKQGGPPGVGAPARVAWQCGRSGS
jgi:hypothetical protein